MIIYVVTQGEYSDKSNVCAFTKEEDADEYIRVFGFAGTGEYLRKESLELNPIGDLSFTFLKNALNNGYELYNVFMNRNGSSKVYKSEYKQQHLNKTDYHIVKGGLVELTLALHTWAKSEDEAVKITNEIRIQLIANDKWEESYDVMSFEWEEE
jgi:hypothetical protein